MWRLGMQNIKFTMENGKINGNSPASEAQWGHQVTEFAETSS